MLHVFDLSGTKSHRFQFFPDAVTAFSVQPKLDPQFTLPVWGVGIPDPLQDEAFCKCLPLAVQSALPTSLYLSGWGILSFDEAQGGQIRVWPYEPTFQLTNLVFQGNENREQPILTQIWPEKKPDVGFEYRLSIVLEQPLGFMALNLKANGRVTLTVDPQDFVTEEQLDQFPERYRYDLTRTRQLQSLLQAQVQLP